MRNQRTKGKVFKNGREYLDTFKRALARDVISKVVPSVRAAARKHDVTDATALKWVRAERVRLAAVAAHARTKAGISRPKPRQATIARNKAI